MTLKEALDALDGPRHHRRHRPRRRPRRGRVTGRHGRRARSRGVRRLVRRDRTQHRRGVHDSRLAWPPLPRRPDARDGVARRRGVGPRCGVRTGAVGRGPRRQLPRRGERPQHRQRRHRRGRPARRPRPGRAGRAAFGARGRARRRRPLPAAGDGAEPDRPGEARRAGGHAARPRSVGAGRDGGAGSRPDRAARRAGEGGRAGSADGTRAAGEDGRGAPCRARRPRRPDRREGRDPPTGSGAARRGPARRCRPRGPDHHPPPDLQRQPWHRQDHGCPPGRRDLPRTRAALQGPADRGRPQRAGGRLPRPDRDEDRRGREVRHRWRALHRRGLLAGGRPVRPGGDRHAGQGDGGPPRRSCRDRGRLPLADGRLHRAEPRPREPLPHRDQLPRLHRRRARLDLRGDGVRRAVRLGRRRARPVARAPGPGPARTFVRQRALRPQRAGGRDRAPRLAPPRGRLPHPRAAAPPARRGHRAARRGGRAVRRTPEGDSGAEPQADTAIEHDTAEEQS